ncbi:MAG: cytochrome c4 [Nitrosomonadales bacterium]|nr:cytochrome c4 [Nitrosomonadales bacterium]
MRRKLSVMTLALGAMVVSAAAYAIPPTAEILSYACAGCHGTSGASAGPSMPSLAGQNKAFFVDAMKKFKSGERTGTVMARLAKGYSDEQIVAMADFFAKQKRASQTTEIDPALVAQGKVVYDNACKRCHLESGKEFEEDTPVVAGQWLKYLQIQMGEFRDGKRKISDKKAEKVKSLTAADWEAAAHFYASQK